MNSNDDLIQKLIDGYSLYTYMVPDDSIPTNRPLHCEGFYLPHIVITDNVLWAMGRTVHFAHTKDKRGLWHFCYTNHPNGLFFSYYPELHGITFMSTKRYKRHEFIVKDNWKLIWDSLWPEKPQDYRIDRLIEQGARFKIAMLDDENIWNIHPVDLPMYHINEGSFNLKTEYFAYVFMIRNVKEIDELTEAKKTFFSTKPESNEDGTLSGKCAPFHAFYNVFDNGEYYNFYDIPRGSRQRYKRLKIFCEKE
ncbi:MAG: hypothetical protein ACOYU4_06510 [Thermodesulfobacteriota bacterium]